MCSKRCCRQLKKKNYKNRPAAGNFASRSIWPAEAESRTQGSRPRPRTQKKSEAKAKDSLSEDRHSRGQGQECSMPRPRTQAQVLSKKKRSSQKFFKRSPQKNVFQKNFQALHKILTIQKIVLSSSRGQANFRGLEASRPRPRTSKYVLEDSTSDGQYLNCRGDASPHRDLGVLPSRFERWMIRRKRHNSSPKFGEKPLQFPAKTFFFGLHLTLAKKHFNFLEDLFFGVHSISATELRTLL